jgi:NAD(P)-dependent dehydrogenase (short-subunit alcohol dehydrogenase family)
MFDLSGMTALVTGASGGIGSAIARALAAQGARLAVSGSNAEKLEAFRTGLGGDHVALACNLSDGAAVDALVPQAVEALGGRLDILINNAGVTRDNLAMRMKDEEWGDVIRINLEAAFRLARAALKPMMRAKYGRIISITSVVGATGNPGQANYAASKAMTSSTMSRLSAPRSSMKLASSVTFSPSTPRCSTTIFFTRSAVSLILMPFPSVAFAAALAARGRRWQGAATASQSIAIPPFTCSVWPVT